METMSVDMPQILIDYRIKLKIKKLDDNSKLPTKAHNTDEGFDLYSLRDVTLLPKSTTKVHTGIACGFPEGYWGQILGRSSLGSKGIDVFAGVIDQTYTGEIIVCLYNSSNEQYSIKSGDKIAQLVLREHINSTIIEVESLEKTDRGEKGFGSSGK